MRQSRINGRRVEEIKKDMAMRLSVISFTEKGRMLSDEVLKKLEKPHGEIEVNLYTKCKACAGDRAYAHVEIVTTSLGEWTKVQLEERNALLFIGACGIAVRAIAPYLVDKLHDVPVLVMDEQGRHIIPILSGHMGGANELAVYIAEKTGAEPVITTATDLNEKFAVDMFAKKNGLFVANKDGIAKVSAKVLAGKEITISIEPGHGGYRKRNESDTEGSRMGPNGLPGEIRLTAYPPSGPVDVVITSQEETVRAAVVLRPKEYIIGMGCKRGKSADEIDGFIAKKISELSISSTQIYALASISQKGNEPGMIEWCRKKGVRFLTYTAEELQKTEGEFKKSAFVEEQVGVDNVCERAAVKASGHGGKLISGKYAENGITIAVSRREWMVQF